MRKLDNETIVLGKEQAAACEIQAHPLDDQKRKYVSADEVAKIREPARRQAVWVRPT